MMVEWRPVLDGYYAISEIGDVRRLVKCQGAQVGKLIKPYLSTTGYLSIKAYLNGKKVSSSIHRLVAAAFLGTAPSLKHVVNHKDGNKLNNHVANLEYCTKSADIFHAYATGLRKPCQGESHGQTKLTSDQVREIRRLWKSGTKQSAIARLFETPAPTIGSICQGRCWRHIL